MTAIQPKRFNWVQKRPAWEVAQAWREKRRAAIEKFQSEAATFTAGLSKAWSNQISGAGAIAAQAASTRLQAQRVAALQSALNISA